MRHNPSCHPEQFPLGVPTLEACLPTGRSVCCPHSGRIPAHLLSFFTLAPVFFLTPMPGSWQTVVVRDTQGVEAISIGR